MCRRARRHSARASSTRTGWAASCSRSLRARWSRARLDAAEEYSRTVQTSAVMVVANGRVVAEWGEPTRRFNVHSIRKSFLSALYGIHVREGRVDLAATLESLGIDDNEPSLTP